MLAADPNLGDQWHAVRQRCLRMSEDHQLVRIFQRTQPPFEPVRWYRGDSRGAILDDRWFGTPELLYRGVDVPAQVRTRIDEHRDSNAGLAMVASGT
jgi:hypothetical protein